MLDLKIKGFCPSDFWDSFDESKESLRIKDKFYNLLTNYAVIGKKYEHVLHVWKAFRMKIMKDYHDLHFKVDVLFLT